ncbi:hypothetical protein IKL45_02090 [Candidatus Saccharibacteria bacterium]|nr:hypothetical protein [Candidatus Saccharibacteria bacterium]
MDNQPQPKPAKKKLIIIIAAAVAVIGLGIGAYFLFFNKPATPNNNKPDDNTSETTDDTVPKASSEKPEDERLKDYENEIALADNDADRLNLILDNVMVLTDLGHPGEALARLQSVDTTGLSDFDLYRVYSHFAYVYDNMGDTAASNSYHDLANSAYDRYEAATNGGQ